MGVSCVDPNYHVCRFSPLSFYFIYKIFACLSVGTDLHFSQCFLSLSFQVDGQFKIPKGDMELVLKSDEAHFCRTAGGVCVHACVCVRDISAEQQVVCVCVRA